MPIIDSIQAEKKNYDVIVVGSGAAGAMSSYVLTRSGVSVLMLEAGIGSDKELESSTKMNKPPMRYNPENPRPIGEDIGDGWAISGEPYIVENQTHEKYMAAKDVLYQEIEEKQSFTWFRARLLGGRTNYWGQTALRFGAIDFKPYDFDGQGVNWPISYDEIAPYYDKVDKLIGVTGSIEGLTNNPDSSYFLTPPKFRAIDHIFRRAGHKIGVSVIAKRSAILTETLPHRKDRHAFKNATDYHQSCLIGSPFQAFNGLIEPALTTGKLDVLLNSMARALSTDNGGRANGVHFIDKVIGRDCFANAKAVVLAAGSLESTRLLLNSTSTIFPNGIGNSTGQLGRWVMDTTQLDYSKVRIPALQGLPPFDESGLSVSHAYAPWTDWQTLQSGKLGFTRGFYMTWKGGRRFPNFKSLSKLFSEGHRDKIYFGKEWKKRVRHCYGSLFSFYTPGEMIPNHNSYCEIDPQQKDQWGIPVLRLHFRWGEQELQQAKFKYKLVNELVTAAGGEFVSPMDVDDIVPNPAGSNHHECGGARMSEDPGKGVTNSFSQVWDCPNIVVADSGVFASTSCKNPTLTIMALAMRASENLIANMSSKGGACG